MFSMLRNEEMTESYAAGQIIFKKGDCGDCMYVVVEGAVDVIIDGRFIQTLGEGEIFGERALIDRTPRSAHVLARSDCKVARIDRSRFNFLLTNTPFFAVQLMNVMAKRLCVATS
ncbi:MAG: cyclic nucleotide-binding domain-containing protein [Chloroflexi bacterium]|nr:cyclic nucleotide-binding domain-containing protein [Chloroflexota bacterium]